MSRVDKNLKVNYIPLKMEHPDLNNIPEYNLPKGFLVRFYAQGEGPQWARVETAAGEFETEEDALAYFENELVDSVDQLEKRCLFLCTEEGEIIGTATAQRAPDDDTNLGRVGWVGIDPKWQGRGLAKPLLSKVMMVLADYYDRAYLTTQTTSFRAVNMYLNFGFLPMLEKKSDIDSWRYMEEILGRRLNI